MLTNSRREGQEIPNLNNYLHGVTANRLPDLHSQVAEGGNGEGRTGQPINTLFMILNSLLFNQSPRKDTSSCIDIKGK